MDLGINNKINEFLGLMEFKPPILNCLFSMSGCERRHKRADPFV